MTTHNREALCIHLILWMFRWATIPWVHGLLFAIALFCVTWTAHPGQPVALGSSIFATLVFAATGIISVCVRRKMEADLR